MVFKISTQRELSNGHQHDRVLMDFKISTQQELSNGHQHDRVLMVFKIVYVIVLLTKVPSALERLMSPY